MSGTIALLLSQPLVRELLLATIGVALVLASPDAKPHRLQIATGFAAYLLFTPNSWTISGRSFRDTRRKPNPLGSGKVKVSKTLLEAVEKDVGPPTGEKYVVIGGAGFIGQRIIACLVARGERNVVCVTRAVNKQLSEALGPNVELVQADARTPESLLKALKGAAVVYSLAAELCFFDWMPFHFGKHAVKNVDGAAVLVECCQKAGVKRLIFTGSSSAMFSTRADTKGYRESTPLAEPGTTITCYGLSKAMAEKTVLNANGVNGMATIVLRPCAYVIGYHDRNFFDRFVMGLGMVQILQDAPIDFLDVDDVVFAQVLAEKELRRGTASHAAGEAINIAPERALTWSELTKIVDGGTRKVFGRRTRRFILPQRSMWYLAWLIDLLSLCWPGDLRKIIGDDVGILTTGTLLTAGMQPIVDEEWRNEKAKMLLGFSNLRSIEDAVDRTLREYQEKRIILG